MPLQFKKGITIYHTHAFNPVKFDITSHVNINPLTVNINTLIQLELVPQVCFHKTIENIKNYQLDWNKPSKTQPSLTVLFIFRKSNKHDAMTVSCQSKKKKNLFL